MSVNTFFILYALDYVTFQELGLLIALQFLLGAFFNIPTGSLADWAGERWVFMLSSILFGLSSILLMLSKDFYSLVIVFVIFSIADAGKTGAFMSWFSNNYKHYVKEDQSFQVFSNIIGKYGMLNMIAISLSFSIGALLIAEINLEFVFFAQGILMILFSFVLLIHYKNHPELENSKGKTSYLTTLVEGIKFTFKDKTMRWLLLGIVITGSIISLWFKLLSYSMYELFGKTDVWIGNIRSGEFLLGALMTGIAGLIASKIINTKLKKYLSFSYLTSHIVLFWGFFLLLLLYKIPDEFHINNVIYYLITYSFATILFYFLSVIQHRFFLDLLPDKSRASINSIIPTFIMVVGAIMTIIGSTIVEQYSLETVFFVLGLIGLLGGIISFGAIVGYKPKVIRNTTGGKFLFVSPFMGHHLVDSRHLFHISEIAYKTESSAIIKQITEELTSVAIKDKMITEEEETIMNVIIADLQAYIVFIDKAQYHLETTDQKRKQSFSKEEVLELIINYKKKIYENAFNMALKDEGMSEDEMNILFKLKDILDKWTIFDEKIMMKKIFSLKFLQF